MKDDHKTKKQLVDELTELRLQNVALKKSESAEKYRSLVENLKDVIYELDSQGVVLYISPTIRDLLGYDSTEIIGKNFIELAHKDDLSSRAEWFSELRKGVESPSEYRIIDKSGEYKWAQTRVRPIIEDGQFKGARGILIDVTEQKRTEKTLRESEEKYRSVFENSIMGISQTLSDGRLIVVNNAYAKMYGYANAEEMMTEVSNVGPLYENPEEREDVLRILTEKGVMEPKEINVIRHDGTRFTALTGAREIRDSKGTLLYYQAEQIDITERRQAVESLRESEELFRSYLEYAPDGVYMSDLEGNFLYGNLKCEAIIGHRREELIGKNFLELNILHEKNRNIAVQLLKDNVEGKSTGPDEIELISKEGRIIPVEISTSVVKHRAQRIILAFVRDISDRKKAEEKMKRTNIFLDSIIENIPNMIFLKDARELRFIQFNRAGEELLGYSRNDLLGKNDYDFFPKEQADHFTEKDLEVLSGKKVIDIPEEILQTVRWGERIIHTKKVPLLNEKGEPEFLLGISEDITETKQGEAKLRQQTDAMDAAIDGMAILNETGEYVYVNKAHARLYGYENAGELIGKPWKILYDLDVLRYFEQEITPELSRKGYWHGEAMGTKKNGSKFPQELSLTAMANGGLICVVRDISDRKRAEEELRLSEERFRRIFDEGPVGLGIESPDHTIIAANKVLCELLGYTEKELVGQNIADITYEEDRKRGKEALGQLFADGTPVFRMEKRYIRKDGTILWTNASISAIHGKEGNVLYGLAIIEDLTASKKAADKIRLLAYYDSLTGLPNRTFHKELIKRAIGHAQRRKEIFALIYIGLDNFKRINDTLGYGIGDLLLKAVAVRLANSLRKSDYVARSDEHEIENVISRAGGDEFIILAHDTKQSHNAAKMSRRLLEELSAPYDLNGREVFVTASIGIALYPDDGTDVENLLKNAEKAMRHTKNEGKNNFHFYSSSMHTSVLEVLTLENDLHRALERNELLLYYQPKVDAATKLVKGMEALIRWKHPDKGMIPPMQFIPMAETSGLIIPIGEFVIRTVCKQIKAWQEAGCKQMNIALNVSSHQLEKQNLIEIFKDALREAMISPQSLEMEITESTIMRNPEKAIQILTELKAIGMGIAIDDFGTGYSSLSYLKRLPLDFLKIDQSFVKGLASDPRDQTIVRTIIVMAHSLSLKTIAEGVETKEQLSFLQENGCDEIQGYLFSRPLPAEEIPGILAKGCL